MEKDIKQELGNITAAIARRKLYEKKKGFLNQLAQKGAYIWGTGKLGEFAYKQCKKNNIKINGFIDNDHKKVDPEKKVFCWDVLQVTDIIIIASVYYEDISYQLQELGINNYTYYEDLAIADERFDIWYDAFKGNFEDLEKNKDQYIKLYDIFADDLSREIYSNIIMYRITLNLSYMEKAFKMSEKEGIQDFDKIVVSRFGEGNCRFFDVGAYDGKSSLDFISFSPKYRHIYIFEPDKSHIENITHNLRGKENVSIINAAVGAQRGFIGFDSSDKAGGGKVSKQGMEMVEMVMLDDYIEAGVNYIKMDVEGYEADVLKGAERFIKKEKPLLGVSVYHKTGDIHKLVNLVLSWNPNYKVYIRQYTKKYCDTVCYFVDDISYGVNE